MTDDELLTVMLGVRDETRELLLESGAPLSWALAELVAVWQDAHSHARTAYEHWRRSPGGEAYAVYRAAQDRADAAQHALSIRARRTDALTAAHG
jgi:hypothetical protein